MFCSFGQHVVVCRRLHGASSQCLARADAKPRCVYPLFFGGFRHSACSFDCEHSLWLDADASSIVCKCMVNECSYIANFRSRLSLCGKLTFPSFF